MLVSWLNLRGLLLPDLTNIWSHAPSCERNPHVVVDVRQSTAVSRRPFHYRYIRYTQVSVQVLYET